MKIAGIIAEYDPFHNGHAYQIAKTRAQTGADGIVVVLGGEFTQRGEGAWCSKYLRAKCALLCGADLVLEMPVPYALGSAERFAKGGVSILDSLNCVDYLSFGSESGNGENILRFAELSESEIFLDEMKKALSEGISAPLARQKATEKLMPKLCGIAGNPNDTLGAEYCKWLLRLKSKMEPVAVKRYGANHGEETVLKSGIASATYLRSFSEAEDIFPFVPAETREILQREFEKYGPRMVLLTDITYLSYKNGTFAYLSTILDAFTKQLFVWIKFTYGAVQTIFLHQTTDFLQIHNYRFRPV